ncbi:MAG: hypothetical protein KDH94_06345, partial [Coxiellaceae bacterium]|nr:hypothetical protein [Coxiellaceae bacterium]
MKALLFSILGLGALYVMLYFLPVGSNVALAPFYQHSDKFTVYAHRTGRSLGPQSTLYTALRSAK